MNEILKVENVMELITHAPAIVSQDSSLKDVLKEMIKDPKTQMVYVVDAHGKLVGVIPLSVALEYLYHEHIPPEEMHFNFSVLEGTRALAREVMLPPIFVKKNDTLSSAFRKMFEYHIYELPVVDENMHIIGDLHGMELVKRGIEK